MPLWAKAGLLPEKPWHHHQEDQVQQIQPKHIDQFVDLNVEEAEVPPQVQFD